MKLQTLAPRVVHPKPPTPYIVAWGDPAVVLRCGVPRPAALTPGSSALLSGVNGVYWLVHKGKTQNTWTSVDRAVYIEVTVPREYRQPPLSPLATAIAKALPQVCLPGAAPGQSPPPTSQLCTRRK